MAHNKKEYELCKDIATYMRAQYPNVLYHYDLAGLNLSRAQAGMMKAIQGIGGFPDLHILEARGVYHGLFLEIKHADAKVFKEDGSLYANPHHYNQSVTHSKLNLKGYLCRFAVGFDDAKKKIDDYLKLDTNN